VLETRLRSRTNFSIMMRQLLVHCCSACTRTTRRYQYQAISARLHGPSVSAPGSLSCTTEPSYLTDRRKKEKKGSVLWGAATLTAFYVLFIYNTQRECIMERSCPPSWKSDVSTPIPINFDYSFRNIQSTRLH